MSGVDRLREANRFELKLSNGVTITYRMPQMRELVIARLLPLDLLDQLQRRLADGGTEVEAVSVAEETMQQRLADYETDYEAQQRVVALMVQSVDGEPVQMQPSDTLEIPQEDFSALIQAAMSRTPVRAEGEV